MSKKDLPVYAINTLTETVVSKKDFSADHFAHYVATHQNLKFPHKHSFYHLVYFSGGSGAHSIDFVNFPVKAGQVYFMIPGQVHSWHFKTAPDGFIVNFSEAYINALIADPRYIDRFSFFSGVATEQVIQLPVNGREKIVQCLGTIVAEGNAGNAAADDVARTALLQLFIYVSRHVADDTRGKQQHYNAVVLRNFQQLIELHYKEKNLTKEYAALLYVTPNHLNALSKDITGRPAGELIRDRILLEAKRLLVNARMSISEIAGELGFSDNSYFSKFFKKYEGVTPEVFRKQLTK